MPSTTNPATSVNPTAGPRNTAGGGIGGVAQGLAAHIADPSNAHMATAIGYAGGPTWADGTTNPATSVEAQLDKILTDLGATTGSAKIHANAQTAGTITLSAGTLEAQVLALIQAANHNYAGGGTWADTTTNPATSVEAQLDKIITDLGSGSGTAKIASAAQTAGTITLSAGTAAAQIAALIQAANHNYAGGSSWLDGTTNPATNVEAQLDKILTDLISTAAANRVGAAAVSGYTAGTIQSQLSEVGPGVTGTTITAPKKFNGAALIASDAASFITDLVPTTKKLLWAFKLTSGVSGVWCRFYAKTSDVATSYGFEVSLNCAWDGTQWVADNTGSPASKRQYFGALALAASFDYAVDRTFLKQTTSSPWDDGSWDSTSGTGRALGNPAFNATIETNMLYSSNIPKAWGLITTDGSGGVTVVDGFNIASVSLSSGDIQVTLKKAFTSADYAVTASSGSLSTPAAVGVPSTSSIILLRQYTTSHTQLSASSNAVAISFTAFGKQT